MVDDDAKLCRLIRGYLEPLGYEVSVANDGVAGLELALKESFDAMILDVMMPKLNGFELLKRLRATSNLPVLVLTGLGDEAYRISGLEIGADDYLPKTFSTRELLARLRAVIRRSRITADSIPRQEGPLSVGGLSVSAETRCAALDGKPLTLTPVEFDLLLSLARAAGRVKTREQLLLEIAPRDFEAFDRSIDVHISSLRRKLGDAAKAPGRLLGGAFSGSAAIKFADRKSILPLKLEDTQMFCPGAGTCIVFLEDWLAAFGSPGELKAMLEARQGVTASLGSNPRFVKMMDNSDALAPVRGVAAGNQFDSLISGGLRDKTGMDLNWAQFSSSISLVGYSLTFERKAHVKATLECKSAFSAAILKQILAALAQAGPHIADMPFQNMEVVSSDATIDLKMDTILPAS